MFNTQSILQFITPKLLLPYWERLKRNPLAYRLARGAFWSLCGNLVSRVSALCASILVARILGNSGFGELGVIQSTVGMLGTIAGLGLGITATKYVAEFKLKDPARAGRIICLSRIVSWIAGGGMALVLLNFGPWLAANTLAAPHLGPYLKIGSVLLLLGTINGTQTGALSGFEAFKSMARINLFSGLLAFPLTVGGAWWGGLEGSLYGLVASQSCNTLLNLYTLRSETAKFQIPLSYRDAHSEHGILWSFSLPALGGGLFVAPVYWICNSIIVNSPGGYGQMGVFNAANQWFTAFMFLPGVLSQAAIPVLSESLSLGDRSSSRNILSFYLKMNILVIAPIIFCGSLASPSIMAIYGPGFRDAWPTMVVALLTAGLLAIQTPVGQIIAASGRMWLGTMMNAAWALCFIGLTAALVDWGALGLAWARLGAYLVHTVWVSGFAVILLKGMRRPHDSTDSRK